ncbi:MAG: SH3 domain-containing protein [Chloroflexota bacterium]
MRESYHIVYNRTMTDIQQTLDHHAARFDKRVSVFDVQIASLADGILTLEGRVLDVSQLFDLPRLFPTLQMDTSSLVVLNRPNLPRRHVATNLTGLYEKPSFGVPLASELTFGAEVEILQEEGRWAFVRQRDGYLGWVYAPYLAEGSAPAPTHLVLAPAIELRAEPKADSPIVTRLVSGTEVTVTGRAGKWSRVEANKSGWIPSVHLRALSGRPRTVTERRATLIEDARRMIGVPYLWGGVSGNGIDCSGFTRLLHRWIGLDIPRDADMQCEAARPVKPPFKVGDLFFFGEDKVRRKVTHVGMSLGGWKAIHSSRTRNGVSVDDAQKTEFLREIYLGAGSFLRG